MKTNAISLDLLATVTGGAGSGPAPRPLPKPLPPVPGMAPSKYSAGWWDFVRRSDYGRR